MISGGSTREESSCKLPQVVDRISITAASRKPGMEESFYGVSVLLQGRPGLLKDLIWLGQAHTA